ncbi:MAG: ornithine cyclodeaminase family protein [Ramlibacter sp.]
MSLAFYSDQHVASVLDFSGVRAVLEQAFTDMALGKAAIFPRSRSDCGPTKLSAMGAIWQAQGVAGMKVYPTVGGQFSFLINLFDLSKNEPIGVFEAGEITRLRTASLATLVALRVVPRTARKLAVIGAGVQGRAIAESLIQQFAFEELCVVDPGFGQDVFRRWTPQLGVHCRLCEAQEAVTDADVVVTASRSKTPVFNGRWLKEGAFVAAVGTSLPNGREIDDASLARAGRVIVEWKPQSLAEAGEIVLGTASGALKAEKVVDLAELYRGENRWRASSQEIVIFKSVGVGLADIATAWLVANTPVTKPELLRTAG